MKLERIIQILTKLFLFFLPWQTVWIFEERFLNGTKWQYGTIQFFATEAILWLIIVLFMFWYLKKYRSGKRERGFGMDRFFILSLFLLVLYAAVSRFWALDSGLAVQYSLYIMEASCLFFIIAFGPVKFRDMLLWTVYGAILPALIGITQFVFQTTFVSTLFGLAFHDPLVAGTSIVETGAGERTLRAYGTFGHPNSFGGYLFFVCMAFVALYYVTAKEFDRKKSMVLSVAGVIVFHALFFTFSRSAWMAFLILFACVSVYTIKNKNEILKKLCVRTLILMVIVFVAYHGYIADRFTVRNTHEQASINERISGYKESWELFKKKPLVGVGVGNYTAASYVLDSGRSGWEYQPVHNVLLLFLVEWGVVGALLLAQVKILYFITFRKYIRDRKILIAVLVFSIAPLALFDHYLLSSYAGLILLGIFGGLFTRYILSDA